MKEWGTELWDRLDMVVHHNKKECQDMESTFGRFLKERGDIEKKYCESLRKLVNNFIPKENKKELEDETSQTKSFRLILQETKYQANQHETLAETYSKTLYTNIQKKIKELNASGKKYSKMAKNLQEEKEESDRKLDKAISKYRRSFFDWEVAEQDYNKGNSDPNFSRNQIERLKRTSGSKLRQCEQHKADYASELIRANEAQRSYYHTNLPSVLNNLQNLEITRANFLKDVLKEGVQAEKSITPILMKCLEEIEKCIDDINPDQDTHVVVHRYKTGNVPPLDFEFEEMRPGDSQDKTKTRTRPPAPSENLYPKKRELQKKIEATEQDILKGQKEMQGLRTMYKSYVNNPQYGKAKNFEAELESATLRVQNLESDLYTYKTELAEINSKLDNLQNRNQLDTPPVSGRHSPHSDQNSMGYGTISNSSNSSEQDVESLGETPRLLDRGMAWDPANAATWQDDDFSEEYEDVPPPAFNKTDFHDLPPPAFDKTDSQDLPPPPPPAALEGVLGTVRALYEFRGEEEININMDPNQEFHILEADALGWTRVRRVNQPQDEGFVPTAFLEEISHA